MVVIIDNEKLNEESLTDLFICDLLRNYLINNFNQIDLFLFLILVQSIKFMSSINLIENYYLTKFMEMDVNLVPLLILFRLEMIVGNIY